ncbi:unnamed protein product [Darwinula stevensoni]|uniref:Uncharacterized protein n=1 Tax=Darwinula stevensoni TaxID=69355 RepID=A0A7R8WZC6_9CRUS|nr:unnamed protein product [Darwinula stevensoni]CAG0880414.1 unnamed protein product [Darwinula stevensoni]
MSSPKKSALVTELDSLECRVLLVGDAQCGKSALIQRFVSDKFLEVYAPTSFDKYSTSHEWSGQMVNFLVWDTSGASAYDSVRPLAYPEARVVLLCFSIGEPESLDHVVTKWYPEIRHHCTTAPIILCGCQSDLRNDIETISRLAKIRRIPVTSEQALQVSRKIEAGNYVETSSRTSVKSVRDAFEVAALASHGRLNARGGGGLGSGVVSSHAVRPPSKTNNKARLDLKYELKDRAKVCSLM